MKNKKTAWITSFAFLIVGVFIGIIIKSVNITDTRTERNETKIADTADAVLTIQDMPTAEEMRTWELGEIYKLKMKAEQIPLDSCTAFLTDEFDGFLNEYGNVKLDNLIIEQDSLSVIEGMNQKSLRNLDVEVNLMVDTTNNVEIYDFVEDISKKVPDYLHQYSYVALKVKRILVKVLDQNSYKIHEIEAHCSSVNETIFAEQEEDEYAVQTLAFQFAEKNPVFVLSKFGKISESKELYVEYKVDDDYFTPAELDKNIADLEKVSEKIKDSLLSQKVTEEYISSNQLDRFTISFFNGIFDDSYQTFSYEL